jgi:hypothetical protein
MTEGPDFTGINLRVLLASSKTHFRINDFRRGLTGFLNSGKDLFTEIDSFLNWG